ncbi:hypothetical protein QAD02_024367 [Eretmocerus hayati]|uniref:Uncharacterized protein n=1 Tax=Eretmocerus hayati TaxID=131215 RepID=A0ACC2Q1Y9_9HYME|nr:hypothetical protein QAD02_024367 [Eretmocerus hayati]
MNRFAVLASFLFAACVFANAAKSDFNQDLNWKTATSIYDFHAKDMNGDEISLDKYQGHTVLIVNIGSQNCGFTNWSYEQLQKFYEKYGESKGLRILAFPSDEFDKAVTGFDEGLTSLLKKHNVSFDIFEKTQVVGESAHPLFKWLKSQQQDEGKEEITFNFSKFLINNEGKPVNRFAPRAELEKVEQGLLKEL